MEGYRAIITKRDTRAFTEQAIGEDVLHRILQAGRMAGSSKNTQPCRFVVIDEQAQKERIATCGDFATWAPNAALLIAVAASDKSTRAEFDAGRAAQNMMVAAWADGVSSCPMSMHRQDCARETLGLPAEFYVNAVIGFGYPAKAPRHVPEAARLPFEEYVRRNRWS